MLGPSSEGSVLVRCARVVCRTGLRGLGSTVSTSSPPLLEAKGCGQTTVGAFGCYHIPFGSLVVYSTRQQLKVSYFSEGSRHTVMSTLRTGSSRVLILKYRI